MATGDADVVALARTVREVYDQAATDLLGVVAGQVIATVPADAGEDWQPGPRDEALAVQRVAEGARRIERRLDRLGIAAGEKALTKAQAAGLRKADRELAALLYTVGDDYTRGERLGALAAWSRDLAGRQRDAHSSILRQSTDAYRSVIAAATAPKIGGAESRRIDIAQRAMDDFARRGVVDFRDAKGRRWELATYVEMATRTATARAMVEAQVDRLERHGQDLLIVSDSPHECGLCRPWEGKVLTRTGTARSEQRTSILGGTVTVKIAGSLLEAMAAGLLHPNCTHGVAAYLPGVTKPPTNTANPKGYEDRQALRALERGVRAAKRDKAAALTPAAKKAANADVKAWNAAIAEHVKKTGLIRQKNREQVGEGRAR